MSQTCDRCGPAVRASYRVERTGELFLCGHCASRHWPMLSAQGWIIWPTGVHALAPQASSALGNPCPVSAASRYRVIPPSPKRPSARPDALVSRDVRYPDPP
jgi:hypothetical protein